MAYIGTEKLKELIKSKGVIGPAPDLTRVKTGAYELSLGSEVFRTDSKDKKKEVLKEKELVTINPGQFALLLTKEYVHIPLDKIALISIKAGVKLRGLINVSGFHVDPGFKGKLVFSVYNAGTSPISLEMGEPYFLIWFSDLELGEGETTSYNGEHKDQDSIPTRYIDALIAGELASPSVLLEKINTNKTELENKINVVDEKKKFNEYLFKTILGLLIFIAIKLLWDGGRYNKGYRDGYDKKATEIKAETTDAKTAKEINALNNKVDSLIEAGKVKPVQKAQNNGKN